MKELKAAICEADSIGLIEIGSPDDEYGGEARLIFAAFLRCGSPEEGLPMIHEIFVACFDEATARRRVRYTEPTVAAWAVRRAYS